MRREDIARDPEWARLLEAACPPATPRPGARERVLERVRQRRHEAVPRLPVRRRRAVAWSALAVACASCLGIVLMFSMGAFEKALAPSPAVLTSRPPEVGPPPALLENEPPARRRVVAAARDELLELERGSRVLARAGTSIEVSEGADRIECRLARGEVLVHVPEGSRGTFSVVTSKHRVEVRGTVFAVSARGGETSVSVWDGRVEVTDGGMRQSVVAGESWPRGAAPIHADAEDMIRLAASARVPDGELGSVEPKRDRAQVVASRPDIGSELSRDGEASARETRYARARRLEAAGDRPEAAKLYESIAAGEGATAEAAGFAAARLYAGLSDHRSLRRVISIERERHSSGAYARALDVLWLRSLGAEGDSAGIEREAERFLRKYPDDPRAPQFRVARALDRARRGRCVEARFDLGGVDTAVVEQIDALCAEGTPSSR